MNLIKKKVTRDDAIIFNECKCENSNLFSRFNWVRKTICRALISFSQAHANTARDSVIETLIEALI